jgi:hypothetical protein
MVRDDFNESTDELRGEFICVHAHTQGTIARLRLADEGECWSKDVLMQIGARLSFGVHHIFDVDVPNRAAVTFTVGVYGWDSTERQVTLEI